MKKTVLLIIGMIVLLCACSCSEEAVIKKITDAIEFEFECEFDVWCDHADDFQEFEREDWIKTFSWELLVFLLLYCPHDADNF